MSNFSLTLQSVINLASTHADLLVLSGVGGYTQEPALSLCNDALSDLVSFGNDWKFNSKDMGLLVTTPNRQEYIFGGAAAFTLGANSSGACVGLATNNSITQNGNTTTVTTLQPHRFKAGDLVYMTGNTVSAYNSVFTDDGNSSTWSGGWTITSSTPLTFTFTHALSGLDPSGAPGITDFGWLESATKVEMNNTSSPQRTEPLQAVKEIQPWSRVANPEKVNVHKDNGDGTVTIRFWYVPGATVWGANLHYQMAAPLKIALSDDWSPFPDHYSAVYRQAVLYRMYRYINSPRADAEYQKLQQEIMKAKGADDSEASDVHLCPEEGSLLGDFWGF
jgi:hypothetical protein